MYHDPKSGIAQTAELCHNLAENDQRSHEALILLSCTMIMYIIRTTISELHNHYVMQIHIHIIIKIMYIHM